MPPHTDDLVDPVPPPTDDVVDPVPSPEDESIAEAEPETFGGAPVNLFVLSLYPDHTARLI